MPAPNLPLAHINRLFLSSTLCNLLQHLQREQIKTRVRRPMYSCKTKKKTHTHTQKRRTGKIKNEWRSLTNNTVDFKTNMRTCRQIFQSRPIVFRNELLSRSRSVVVSDAVRSVLCLPIKTIGTSSRGPHFDCFLPPPPRRAALN